MTVRTAARPGGAAPVPAAELAAAAAAASARAVDRLLADQHPAGWWRGELATNVTIEAEDLLLREFLGVRRPRLTAETAAWIRSQQRPDGSWATFAGGPGDLSTTVEAYLALRLAGDPPQAGQLRAAAAFVAAEGGLARCRVFTRLWLALFGCWPWAALPVLPPELIMLPRWAPLNVYDFACWARQTVVPLTVVSALRPVRRLPFPLTELPPGRPGPPTGGWAVFSRGLDAVLHRYQHHPLPALRRAALRRCAEWIVARQEADGSWGGIQPPWVYSLIALHLLGYPLGHPVLRAGLTGLDRFTVRERTGAGWVRRLEACQSPVWDSALAVLALTDAGLPAGHPALRRAADWLLGQEIRTRGDWAVRRPALPPGGWAFEFDNDGYPDVDDTAVVALALRRVADPQGRAAAAVARALGWVTGMQCRDGGWAAFDADNTRTLVTRLPFCDFGAVTDPPSADVTGHVVEMLAGCGRPDHPATRRGVVWLLSDQRPGGSWFGRWGANHLYGTGAVLPALTTAGVPTGHPAVRRAVGWLHARQNPDGGWGEDLRSYRHPGWVGRGASTPSQTAWALLALLAAGDRTAAVHRGVRWLCDRQRRDGGWDEPQYTGTGFPGDFYINYQLYRVVFPLSALGRYLAATRPAPEQRRPVPADRPAGGVVRR